MTSVITIDFQGGAMTNSSVEIAIGNSAITLVPDPSSSLGMATALQAGNINVTSGGVQIGVTGGQFTGRIGIPISLPSQGDATVTLKVSPTPPGIQATVAWSSITGGQMQPLVLGDPLTLSGLVDT